MSQLYRHFLRAAAISWLALLIGLLIAFFTGCAGTVVHKKSVVGPKARKKARITYYTGRHEKLAMGGRAIAGVSCAAHPKYAFGTKIKIPELIPFLGSEDFTIQDRGSAVTKAKAARGKGDVFDIYVQNSRIMNWMGSDAPEWMEVQIW